MTRRSVAAWIVGLGLVVSAPGGAQAQTTTSDLSTLMRTQILDIWLSRTPDGQRILIDPPSGDLRTLSPFTLVTPVKQAHRVNVGRVKFVGHDKLPLQDHVYFVGWGVVIVHHFPFRRAASSALCA